MTLVRDLVAPNLPREGPLPAIPHGWLVRHSDGRFFWSLIPAGPHRTSAVRTTLALPVAAVAGAVGVALFGGSLLFVIPAIALSLILSPFARGLANAWFIARATAGVRRKPLAKVKHGDAFRVEGKIRSGATFVTALTNQPVVLARYRARVGIGMQGYAGEATRAVDFAIETDEGEIIQISARDAFLLDKPRGSAPALSTPLFDFTQRLSEGERRIVLYDEAAVGPGDRVEVVGTAIREVDPAGAAAPGRGTPLSLTIRALPSGLLFVRNLTPAVRL